MTKEEIWESRRKTNFAGDDVFIIGREAYIKNKKATGRNKDLADLELLGE